jgi:2-oxoglutarate ferredoxin oxidoreductase subunit alpha
MMEPVVFEKKPGRQLPSKDWALTGADGREQRIVRSLWLKEGVLEQLNYKLQDKYKQALKEVICYQHQVEDADIVLVAFGIAARMVRAAVNRARELGIKAGLIRPLTLWPFPYEQISKAANEFRIFLTVELNCGQMVEDVKLAVAGKSPVLFYGRPAGGIPSVEDVLEKIKQLSFNKEHIKV